MATKKKGQEAEPTPRESGATPAEGETAAKGDEKAKADKSEKARAKELNEKKKGRDAEAKAAPKKKAKDKDDDSEVGESIKDVRQFLREVAIEFRKITWPGRAQVFQETYSVLFLVTVITLMVLAFDWVLGHAVFGPLEHWARLHGGGVGRS